MCGFVGILRLGERPIPHPEVIRRMVSTLHYRGPDDTGEFFSDDVQLAVVRLAIVDLNRGQQPVASCKGGVTGVFNGEIYNYAELRAGLAEGGHRLRTACDTEVVPHLYVEEGESFVRRVSGMFSLALWDQREKRLLLARDRLGIKPLYWARTRDYLLFASEIKALLASGCLPAEIDRDSLDDLFSLSYPCPPRTMFRGVHELRPAHTLSARAGGRMEEPRRYWRAPFVPSGEHGPARARDAEAELYDALVRKVETHLQADVPVASYLSGGLDSSTISAIAAQIQGEPLATFSIGFTSPQYDEREYAARVVKDLGAPNYSVLCDNTTANHYPEMLWHTELPLQFPLALPLMLLSRAARREGFRVVLTGEGADELLAGYDCFRADKMRRLLDRRGLRSMRGPFYRNLYRWLGSPAGLVDHFLETQRRPADEIRSAFGGVYPPWYDVWAALGIGRGHLLSPDGRRVRPIHEAPEGFDALVPDDVSALHPLDAGLALELETRLPSWILLIADRASMANAVEARVPLLDHEIVELAARMHPSLKLNGFTEKAVLRTAMRGRLPEAVRRRRKRPFYTPIKSWFFAEGRPAYVDDLLSERALRDAGLFEPRVVRELRTALEHAPDEHLLRMRLEWMLILILGTQLLHHMFVADFGTTRFWADRGPGVAGAS